MMKIAIIGSGISGLYAAWKLGKVHEVTVFEKNNYFGGHTDTHQLNIDGEQVAVDSGFIVFNEHNYPLFCAMLKDPHKVVIWAFPSTIRSQGCNTILPKNPLYCDDHKTS